MKFLYSILASALCLISFIPDSQAQTGGIITTLAGNGTAGYAGDGGPATLCEFNLPMGIALDSIGRVFISDKGNGRIRQIDTGGIITTLPVGSFSGPAGLCFDTEGFLYIADQLANKVWKINVGTGSRTGVAGTGAASFSGDGGPATNARLYLPAGVAVDAAGNIYIADAQNNRIRKVTKATGIIKTIAGNGTAGYSGDGTPADSAKLSFPTGVAVDLNGNVYIADNDNHRIRMVDTTGTISTVAGNGSAGPLGDGGPATAAELYNPNNLFIDASGIMYIADQNNHKIRIVDASGTINTFAGTGAAGDGGDGASALSAGLYFPAATAPDAAGNMYIADEFNNRIRKVSTTASTPTILRGSNAIVYPNPATDKINIKTDNGHYDSATITNILGQAVISQELHSAYTMIVISQLPAGLYYLALRGENDTQLMKFQKL